MAREWGRWGIYLPQPGSPRPLSLVVSMIRQGGLAEEAIRSPVVQAGARAGHVPRERPAGIRRSARSVGRGVRRDAPPAGGPHGALEGGVSFRSEGCSGRPRRTATANAATGAAGLSPGTRHGARPRSRRGESSSAAGRKTRNAGREPPHGLVSGSTTCWGRLRQVDTPSCPFAQHSSSRHGILPILGCLCVAGIRVD